MQEHGQQGALACEGEKPGQVSCEQKTSWPWSVHGGHAWQTRAWEKEEPDEQTRGMQVGEARRRCKRERNELLVGVAGVKGDKLE